MFLPISCLVSSSVGLDVRHPTLDAEVQGMYLLASLGAGAYGRAASKHWTCASSDVRSTPGNPCGLHLDASPVLPGTAVGRLRGQVQRNRLQLLVHFISNSTCARQWYRHCSC